MYLQAQVSLSRRRTRISQSKSLLSSAATSRWNSLSWWTSRMRRLYALCAPGVCATWVASSRLTHAVGPFRLMHGYAPARCSCRPNRYMAGGNGQSEWPVPAGQALARLGHVSYSAPPDWGLRGLIEVLLVDALAGRRVLPGNPTGSTRHSRSEWPMGNIPISLARERNVRFRSADCRTSRPADICRAARWCGYRVKRIASSLAIATTCRSR